MSGRGATSPLMISIEEFAGISTVMTAVGAAVYGVGFSVAPPRSLGFATDGVKITYEWPISISAAGNGALAVALEELTSGSPVVVDDQLIGQGFIFGSNSRTTGKPASVWRTKVPVAGGARQFAIYGYLLVDTAGLTANLRSVSAGIPKGKVLVEAC